MDWKYETDREQLDRGSWLSAIGEVKLTRPELLFSAWVFLDGKRIRVNDSASESGLWQSAEAAKAGVERVYRKQKGL